jgi:hypothetical protein
VRCRDQHTPRAAVARVMVSMAFDRMVRFCVLSHPDARRHHERGAVRGRKRARAGRAIAPTMSPSSLKDALMRLRRLISTCAAFACQGIGWDGMRWILGAGSAGGAAPRGASRAPGCVSCDGP